VSFFRTENPVDWPFLAFLAACFLFSVAQAVVGIVVMMDCRAVLPIVYSVVVLALAVIATVYWLCREVSALTGSVAWSFRHTRELHSAFLTVFLSWFLHLALLYSWWISEDLDIDSMGPGSASVSACLRYQLILSLPVFFLPLVGLVLSRAAISHLWPEILVTIHEANLFKKTKVG